MTTFSLPPSLHQLKTSNASPWRFEKTRVILSLALLVGVPWMTQVMFARAGRAGQAANAPTEAELPPARPKNPPVPPPIEDSLARLQSVISTVHDPNPRVLAKALGVELVSNSDGALDSAANVLGDVGDLDGNGVAELVLKWWRNSRLPGEESPASESPGAAWGLFLLAWDGARWHASRLLEESQAFELEVIQLFPHSARSLAVVLYAGETDVPYPVVFWIKEHAAFLLWDGRLDDSLYKGQDYGRVEFRDVNGDGLTEMIVTGRADPGLLVFPKNSSRGFEARAVYSWDGKAYVPSRTEYSANPDYTLYRFISALHLHNFKAAYALIDAQKFLQTDQPSLELFKKHVEDSWPEFLDDQVFEAQEISPTSPDDYAFALPESEKRYVYHPTLSGDGKLLLTGLERRTSSVTSDPPRRDE